MKKDFIQDNSEDIIQEKEEEDPILSTAPLHLKLQHKNEVINIILDTLANNKQALVFVNSKRAAEKTAEDIAKAIASGSNELVVLSERLLTVLSKPTEQCKRLANSVKKGIAYHHAGLLTEQKNLVEDSFKSGAIRVICCTPSLAYGVDTPAFRVIVRDLKRYTHHGMDFIPVLEYQQMAGRAGRPGKEIFGEAICIAQTENEKEKIFDKYVYGEAEEIYSKLAVEPVLRTYLLSLIATNIVNSRKSILQFFSKTFWAYQFKDMKKLEKIIEKMLTLLQEYKFIQKEGETFQDAGDLIGANRGDEINQKKGLFSDFADALSLSQELDQFDLFSNGDKAFGEQVFIATLIGRRVSELYLDPLTAHHIISALQLTEKKLINDYSYLSMICSTLEMRPLLRVKVKEYDVIQEQVLKIQDFLLILEPPYYDPDYEDFVNAMKTTFFLHDWVNESDEVSLLEKYDVRPGEIRVKVELADWLLYSSEELAKLLQMQKLVKDLAKLRYRVQYGAKDELLALLQLQGIGRIRARKLFSNGIKDLGDIKKIDLQSLVQLIGKSIAVDIKQQVGEKVRPEDVQVKQNKRKGDISLKDF